MALMRKNLAFSGRWNGEVDPIKIGEENFSALENLRYGPLGPEGIQGYSPITTTPLGQGSELVTNGDMELDSDWSDVGSPTTNERSSEQANAGTYSRKFTVDAESEGIKNTAFTTTADVVYVVSAYVYPDDGTSVDLIITKGSGVQHSRETYSELKQDAWNKIIFLYTESAGGASADIRLVAPAGVTSGSWYIDDVSVKPRTGYFKGRSGIQLQTPYDVSHVLAQVYNAGLSASQVLENKTAIPNQGNFEATELHTDESGAGLGRFSRAPGGQIVYCNQKASKIYAGAELPAAAFLTSTAAITGSLTNPRDYSEQIRNLLQTADQVALVGGGNDSYTKLLLNMDGADAHTTFADASGSAHGNANVVGNAQGDTAQKKFGTASLLLDGTGDYIWYGDHADFYPGTGRFTADFHIRFNALPTTGNSMVFFSQYDDGSNLYSGYIWNDGGTYKLVFYSIDTAGGTGTIQLTVTWTGVAVNTWYHLAFIRGWGDNDNAFCIAVDGTSLGTDTDTSAVPDLAGNFEIGRLGDNTSFVNGWIDEFRWSKGIARWTANFTPQSRAYASSALYWVVGSPRPVQGVKFYIPSGGGNTASSPTLTGKEWNGASWTALTITDNTSGLASTGTVTFSSTVDTSKPKFLEDRFLYWYYFSLDVGNAEVYHCTLDLPFQDILDLWDGIYRTCIGFHPSVSSVYEDYTVEVATESSVQYPIAGTIGGLADTDHLILMFEDRTTAIKFTMLAAKTNSVAATATIYYWNGSAYTSVGDIVDGTLDTAGGTKSLNQSGTMSWQAPEPSEEFPQTLFGKTGYAYKIVWSATLTNGTKANVSVDICQGVPAQKQVHGYRFPFMFQRKLMLCGDIDGKEGNRVDYSQTNAAGIFNGDDAALIDDKSLYFGGKEDLLAAAELYNRYGAVLYNVALFLKATSAYVLDGYDYETFQIRTVSNYVGIAAPLSLDTAELAFEMAPDAIRNIVFWLSYRGPMVFDGAVISPIPGISRYFEPSHSDFLGYSSIEGAIGKFDPLFSEYNLIFPDSDLWLAYDLIEKGWYRKRVHHDTLYPQIAFTVEDDDGALYNYAMLDTGQLVRLEYGTGWDGANITYLLDTAGIIPSGDPFDHTIVKYVKVICERTSEDADIAVSHYGDGESTGDVLFYVGMDAGTASFVKVTEPCYQRAWSHLFRFKANMNNEDYGVRLIAWSFQWELDDEDLKTTIAGAAAAASPPSSTVNSVAIDDGDTSPNMGTGHYATYYTQNSGSTTITALDGGEDAAIRIIHIEDDNTIFQHSTVLQLEGGLDYQGATGDVIVFSRRGTRWRELSRSMNS